MALRFRHRESRVISLFPSAACPRALLPLFLVLKGVPYVQATRTLVVSGGVLAHVSGRFGLGWVHVCRVTNFGHVAEPPVSKPPRRFACFCAFWLAEQRETIFFSCFFPAVVFSHRISGIGSTWRIWAKCGLVSFQVRCGICSRCCSRSRRFVFPGSSLCSVTQRCGGVESVGFDVFVRRKNGDETKSARVACFRHDDLTSQVCHISRWVALCYLLRKPSAVCVPACWPPYPAYPACELHPFLL